MSSSAIATLARTRDLVLPALREAVERLQDPRMRAVCGYHFGWLDADGQPADAFGGKALRPALAVLSAEAAGADSAVGIAPAIAVELVHNFSLLHDDVMDRDTERRHRSTGWVVFGDGQAILGGSAMLVLAIEELLRAGDGGSRCLPSLVDMVQDLISGQSADLAMERQPVTDLNEVLRMEAGKTAALIACSSKIGAIAAGAPAQVVDALGGFGYEIGMAFQLVDDVLGIVGDSASTGKSASSDVRARKRSAPIVAALTSGTSAGERLRDLFADSAPARDEDVALAAKLIDEAGGIDWASTEARRRLDLSLAHLSAVGDGPATEQFAALARYVVDRDR
ncbi:MAG TPA: polyprenyl synthetase family protein [Jatrophihabitantaceae bacterium]|jgi:geranylgeranyl diphosphate synthase type I